MKMIIKYVALLIWLTLATLLYCCIWTRHPSYFPTYPDWLGLFIGDVYGLNTEGSMEDFWMALWLTISFFNVALFTAVGWLAWRFRHRLSGLWRRLVHRQSGT
ncbi:hypothetical protein [Burkholderia latens]|uniref:Uncharacterized protein n=1 Tax=Burkholderia latens TaxID=488446 RepID=A0A6H9SUV2_9BURK|nr:hypothetical protein [Burkholderia latens]KAB0635991.1 hypothetical protein F7R21_23550 [Burkholderia latens]VWB88466.1 hypothetical protein BLA24064_04193 [Burkholderia latens]